jgi:hypothetical protein
MSVIGDVADAVPGVAEVKAGLGVAKWVALILLVLAVVGGIAYGGFRIAKHFDDPVLAKAQTDLATLQASYNQLQTDTNTQSAAVADLKAESAANAKRAAEAMQTAKAANQSKEAAIAALLAAKEPAGDSCKAAASDFDAELKQERAKK